MDRRVFINYRGEDSHSYGDLLYIDLIRQFGDHLVFLDCESIPAGADFVTELLARVRSARVVLAVIGPHWLTATGRPGQRRIDDPEDWIRRELVEAFAAGVRVIPVLTDDATLPKESQLPRDIAALSRCQARHLRRRDPVACLARIAEDLIAVDETLREAAATRGSDRDATRLDVAGPARWPLGGAVAVDLLGVHRCAAAVGMQGLPAYVPRDRDDDLRDQVLLAVNSGGLVVVEGASGAGKTRSAANVMHEVLADWPLFVADHASQVPAVARAVSAGTGLPCVLWLDDLDRFLGPDGLTPRVLDALVGHRVVVLATLRSERHAAMSRGDENAEAMVDVTVRPEAQTADLVERVLRRAAIVVYDRMWSAEEVSLARSADDPRLDEAASLASEYGIAEFLTAGPQILAEYRRAWAPGGHPRGAALISAAIDFSRAGLIGDIPAELIVAVHGHYLSQQQAHRLKPESIEDAWVWSTTLRCGATSPLQAGQREGTFAAFDYLVDAAESNGERVPEIVWQAALEFCADALSDRYLVGLMAWRLSEIIVAEQAWIPLVENGYGPAAFMLGQLYQRLGRVDDAERCYRVGIDGGDYRSAVNLAACCMRRGDVEQGAVWYRTAADNGEWLGAVNLAQIMRDHGDWQGAIRWYLRACECGETLDALHIVAAIYEEHGRTDLAEAWYEAAIEVGSLEALINFGEFYYRQGNLDSSETLCDIAVRQGAGFDAHRLKGDICVARGDHGGAEQAYRRAFEAGEPIAAAKLARLLQSCGRTGEAKEWADKFVLRDSAGNRINVDILSAD